MEPKQRVCVLRSSSNHVLMLIRLINYPYPATHYCDLPLEDQTNHPLCRLLPTARFPVPKTIVQATVLPPPPGSAGWVSLKSANNTVPARGARGRGIPTSLHIPASSRGSSKAPASAKSSLSPSKTRNKGGSSSCGYRSPPSRLRSY